MVQKTEIYRSQMSLLLIQWKVSWSFLESRRREMDAESACDRLGRGVTGAEVTIKDDDST